ncbi:MAG: helix-turn-helix transcriptional regulator [Fluviibacter sp.]
MNPTSPIWTVAQACEYLQICRAHFYSLIRTEPAFPKPLRLGQTVRFRAGDFEQYVADKISGVNTDLGAPQRRGRGRPRKSEGAQ